MIAVGHKTTGTAMSTNRQGFFDNFTASRTFLRSVMRRNGYDLFSLFNRLVFQFSGGGENAASCSVVIAIGNVQLGAVFPGNALIFSEKVNFTNSINTLRSTTSC